MPELNPAQQRPLVALSSCLMGEPVRYDGTDRRDDWLADRLGEFVQYQGYCPEVGIGLGVPRAPIRLVQDGSRTRVLAVADGGRDFSVRLRQFALDLVPRLAQTSAYVFKARSPSCGLHAVPRFDILGHAVEPGVGAVAGVISEQLPDLPLEEETGLQDPLRREHFVTRVFARWRWLRLLQQAPGPGELITFHAHHKYQLMAHSIAAYTDLGRLLSDFSNTDMATVLASYQRAFMRALSQQATRAGHVNVLQHLSGHLKRVLTGPEKARLADAIEHYRQEQTPLGVPINLLLAYFERYPDDYIAAQTYLNPYPQALGLRNTI